VNKTIFLIIASVFWASSAFAMEITDTLVKQMEESNFPHEKKMVKIRIVTKVDYLRGNEKSEDFERARKIHEMLVRNLGKAKWTKDKYATDDIDAGTIELEIGEGLTLDLEQSLRLKVFIHQCSEPMRKYRGGDINEFFAKIIKESEECLTYDNNLKGPNWPY